MRSPAYINDIPYVTDVKAHAKKVFETLKKNNFTHYITFHKPTKEVEKGFKDEWLNLIKSEPVHQNYRYENCFKLIAVEDFTAPSRDAIEKLFIHLDAIAKENSQR